MTSSLYKYKHNGMFPCTLLIFLAFMLRVVTLSSGSVGTPSSPEHHQYRDIPCERSAGAVRVVVHKFAEDLTALEDTNP